MLLIRTATIALVLALGAGFAIAQDIAGKAQEAEELLKRGRVIEAIDALDAATSALWDRAPLAFRRGVWVSQKADGFGIYNPRANNVFRAGEQMLLYAEPVGFGWRETDGIYRTDMVADVVFKDANGKELFRKDQFATFTLASRYRNREFMLNLTYSLSGAPAGQYLVETTLHDRISGKKGSFTMPFAFQ